MAVPGRGDHGTQMREEVRKAQGKDGLHLAVNSGGWPHVAEQPHLLWEPGALTLLRELQSSTGIQTLELTFTLFLKDSCVSSNDINATIDSTLHKQLYVGFLAWSP